MSLLRKIPKPDGPVVPSSSIAAANKEVKQVLDYPENGKKNTKSKIKAQRGTYIRPAVIDRSIVKDFSANFSIHAIRENILLRKFPAIRYYSLATTSHVKWMGVHG